MEKLVRHFHKIHISSFIIIFIDRIQFVEMQFINAGSSARIHIEDKTRNIFQRISAENFLVK